MLDALAQSDPGIESVLDNVAKTTIDAQLQPDVGIVTQDGP